MDRLWAPWRLSLRDRCSRSRRPNAFSATRVPAAEPISLLFRGRHCFVILNLYPYNNGHLMVVPNRHLSALEALTPDEQAEMMALARLVGDGVDEAYSPHGINVGINLGKAAGAGIENHLHMHRRAALVRRHEFHDRDRRDARAAGGSRGDGRSASTDFRKARPIR